MNVDRWPVEINSIRTKLNSGNGKFVTSACTCMFVVLLQLTVARLGPQHASGRYYIANDIYSGIYMSDDDDSV